ncbi:Multifunctional non-homologous end joining protein LigD [Includes: 3'-phosphoesterase; DNA ligase D; DNA repair polymerase] [Nitrospira japonica]|uniref:DNA ligase (ATP) n=1 Tax=Nitrospira japonica TaxID=1325564 RepID=A0A1W1I2Z9_9BACT|nr:DNA ligase D [Nitrospira japonica]SLM47345.1 Multifunctional non-homologous end joining protein LigD [Includes: 3'-phosphoesterase; DNA ligase D; DNA repair polymerase] [Nitrospira japonica]
MKRGNVARQLQRYRLKRDFVRTPEPSGRRAQERSVEDRLFVIQKHAATRLHYDFRLELDGTLKSWAVPKGPSLDPSQKRLAVHVEDHPLDYAEFEGTIPSKQYGAGTVLIWDRGTWQPIGDPHDGYRRGVLKFRLDGRKLHGAWALVRMHPRGKSDRKGDENDNWLLIKEKDESAERGSRAEIVERSTESVKSGRQLEEVAESHVPSLKAGDLTGARQAPLPERLSPQLATLVDAMPSGEGWIHEIKYDGYRILCRIRRGKAQLFTRNGNDWTEKLSVQVQAVESLGLTDAWLDGEVVVFTEEGKTDFQALQNAFDANFTGRIAYCLFDIPYVDGYDLRAAPLIERKRLLAALLDPLRPGRGRGSRSRQRHAGQTVLRYSDHITGQGETSFEEACRRGLEGLIAKRADSVYRSGRGRSWLKVKCERRQEFVIGGFTEPAGSRSGFGALLVGYYEQGRLRYAGRVGTGFSMTSLRTLRRRLTSLEQSRPPFADPPTGREAHGIRWVSPELVAEVRFSEWTKDGLLRQPSFQGLRTDKAPRSIGRERSASEDTATSPASPEPNAARAAVRGTTETIRLTHPDRVLYPDVGLTKKDLARYYELVADRILPHLRGRPLTLVRCPRDYQDCFYQKHVNERMPPGIGRVPIEEDGGRAMYMTADSLEALQGLVQMNALELHTWGATRDRLDRPDRLTFDLDPDPSLPWPRVVEAAQLMRELLTELGLACFLKTTGGHGLHVVTPIQRNMDWEDAKGFAKSVADHMAATIPQRFISVMAKRARKGKIFIDYLRNGRGATAIAAYSPRARSGAPVSMPIAWEELHSARLKSDHFTVLNIEERLKDRTRDPWEDYAQSARTVTNAMKARLSRR